MIVRNTQWLMVFRKPQQYFLETKRSVRAYFIRLPSHWSMFPSLSKFLFSFLLFQLEDKVRVFITTELHHTKSGTVASPWLSRMRRRHQVCVVPSTSHWSVEQGKGYLLNTNSQPQKITHYIHYPPPILTTTNKEFFPKNVTNITTTNFNNYWRSMKFDIIHTLSILKLMLIRKVK